MNTLQLETLESKNSPLWWHDLGLTYTASGYGRKIPTRTMVKHDNRWKRIYCCIYSNIGTCYIISNKEWIVIN